MKTLIPLIALVLSSGITWSQEVVIKGTLRCTNNGVTTSTRGAANIIIIPSFNPAASVATTTTPQGFFQISTGWKARDLTDKNVTLFILTKCKTCKTMQRVFVSQDLNKRNTDPGKMIVTVQGWKILENCDNTELEGLMSEQLLDSARRLPPQDISGKAPGSGALAPVSFLNLFQKLANVAAGGVGFGFFKAISIPEGKIRFGRFLHTSVMSHSDNTGFNFAPSRNLSEAVYWNAASIANARKPHNVSLLSNFKNNFKLSGYQQITDKIYVGLGGIYTRQDQFRKPVFTQLGFNTTIPHPDKLEEFAAFAAPVYRVNNKLSFGLTLKSTWQKFNNPDMASLENDDQGNLQNFFIDDNVDRQVFDVDLSASYQVTPFLQAGASVLSAAGSKMYADMFIKGGDDKKYINQRAYGIGLSYKRGRLNAGVDALFTDDEFYDASVGVNYVPFNDALVAAGYAFNQQSISIAFQLKSFRIAYINDNDFLVNEKKVASSKLFNGQIYSGFVFNF